MVATGAMAGTVVMVAMGAMEVVVEMGEATVLLESPLSPLLPSSVRCSTSS